ncbi:hypothetical protein K6H10_002393 [Candida tropicalis]
MTSIMSDTILTTTHTQLNNNHLHYDHHKNNSPLQESFNLLNLERKSLPSDISTTTAIPDIHIDIDIDIDINNIESHINNSHPPSQPSPHHLPLSPAMSDTTIVIQQVDSPVDEANHYSTTTNIYTTDTSTGAGTGEGTSSYEFINILRDANLSNFSSFYYLTSQDTLAIDITKTSPASFLPNEYETIAHLKLIKAFAVLKKKVLNNSQDSNINSNILWKCYIINAVRRFIIFVSSLKKFMERYETNNDIDININKDPAFLSVMTQIIPPLDVLLVWHSFLTNPSSFYDVFVRCNMLQFANFAFPLHKVCQYIDNFDFEFRVPYEYKHNYLEVIKCFIQDDDNSKDLQYELTKFSMDDCQVNVCCPSCNNVLSDPIPLSDGSKGFGDYGLRSKNIRLVQDSSCYCSWIFLITHSELRKLQLYSDVKKQGILQGTFKIPPSEVIVKDPIKSGKKFKSIFDRIWNENRFKSFDIIINLLQKECDKQSLPHGKLLQNYTKFNLISMTVSNGIEIGDDLVDFVLKQEQFNNKMNKLNWIHSPNINHILNEANSRYAKFFTILTNPNLNNNNKLKPTLDIELMWKTHNLSGFGYFKDCLTSSSHYIIDDDSTISNSLMNSILNNNDLNKTAEIFKNIYDEEYLICYCQSCTIDRAFNSINPEYQPLPNPHPHTYHIDNNSNSSSYLKPPQQQQHQQHQQRQIIHANSFDENMYSKNSQYSWDFNDYSDDNDDQYSSTSAPAGILTNNSLLDESDLIDIGLGGDNEFLDYFSYPTTTNTNNTTTTNDTNINKINLDSSPIQGSVSPNQDEFIEFIH